MKKLFFLLALMLLISCDKEEILRENISENTLSEVKVISDSLIVSTPEVIQTRASVYIPDILDQISNIPVNIINVGFTEGQHRYLSASPKGEKIDLYSKDDDSERQRFFIRKSSLSLSGISHRVFLHGGNKNYKNGVISSRIKGNSEYPALMEYDDTPSGFPPIYPSSFMFSNFNFIPLKDNPQAYNISKDGRKLQTNTRTSRDLKFDFSTSYYGTDLWNIIPVGDYELKSIKYVCLENEGDKIERRFQRFNEFGAPNLNNSTPITLKEKATKSYSVSSRFSKTHGLTITQKLGSSLTVGLPIVKSFGFNISVDYEYTTSEQWTFEEEKTEARTETCERELTLVVPANTNAYFKIYHATFHARLTYIAEISNGRGKTLYVKGKWTGEVGDGLYVEPSHEAAQVTGAPLLRSILP